MAELDTEIATFESRATELEAHHPGKWVIIHGSEFVGAFDSFDSAAREAVRLFGRGPYLIRQVGAPAPNLPVSVYHRPLNAGR